MNNVKGLGGVGLGWVWGELGGGVGWGGGVVPLNRYVKHGCSSADVSSPEGEMGAT